MQSRQWTSINNLWNIQFNALLWTLNNFHQAMQFNSKQMVYVYRCNAVNAVTRSLDVSSTSVYTWLDFNASCLYTSAFLTPPSSPWDIDLIMSSIFSISDQYARVGAMNFWSRLLLTDLCESFAHLEVSTDFYSQFVWQLESLKLR